MEKVCNICGDKNFKENKVQHIYKHDNNFLIVNNVPCEECEYCGEQYFKAEVLKRIEKDFKDIYLSRKKANLEIKATIEEFVEI